MGQLLGMASLIVTGCPSPAAALDVRSPWAHRPVAGDQQRIRTFTFDDDTFKQRRGEVMNDLAVVRTLSAARVGRT